MAAWWYRASGFGPYKLSPPVAALYQTAYDGGADVALAGHDHHYERFAPQNGAGQIDQRRGIREFVVGTGGRSHYPLTTIRPNSEIRNTGTYGVLELTLHSTSYEWRFVGEPGTTFTDHGTQTCH